MIQPQTATVSALHNDNIGTPLKATSSTQTLVYAISLNPQGAGTASPATIQMNLRFPGTIVDSTGYFNNGLRTYSPFTYTPRYLQPDPIGLSGGLNPYIYGLNNPFKYTDPSGLCVGPLAALCVEGAIAVAPEAVEALSAGVGEVSALLEGSGAIGAKAVGAGISDIITPLQTASLTGEQCTVQFGSNEEQLAHAFRHIEQAGFDQATVKNAILQDLSKMVESLPLGQYNGSVVVNGTSLDYGAYKLPNGVINVGRITPPR